MTSELVGMQYLELLAAADELRRTGDRIRRTHDDVAHALRAVEQPFPGSGAIVGVAAWADTTAADIAHRAELMMLWEAIFPWIPPWWIDASGSARGELDDVVRWFADNVVPLWKGDEDTFPIVSWLTNTSTVIGLLRGEGISVFPNTPFGRWLTGLGGEAGPLSFLSDWSGVFGKVAVGSALATGVMSAVSLAQRGNPVDAAQRDPSGFLVDASGTVMGAAEAVALVTGEGSPPALIAHAVAGAAGTVYVGAQVWDHWDDIGRGFEDAQDWVGGLTEGAKEYIADPLESLIP